MSDLISRSELYMNDLIRRKDVLALFPTNDCSDKIVGLYERVLDIPTAYDVDMVVAKLEEKADSIPIQYEYNYEKGISDGIGDAIDIVRKGGVNEPTENKEADTK